MNSNFIASTRCINVESPAALKIDKSLNRNVVAYKTVIAPGEHYITPGVAVVSKLHWSLLQFKAELSLLTAWAPSISLSLPPCYKKSIGFQIAEEHTRLILNGYSSRACLSVRARYDEGAVRGLGAPTPTSDTWLQWGLSWIFWYYHFHAGLGGLSLCLTNDGDVKSMSRGKKRIICQDEGMKGAGECTIKLQTKQNLLFPFHRDVNQILEFFLFFFHSSSVPSTFGTVGLSHMVALRGGERLLKMFNRLYHPDTFSVGKVGCVTVSILACRRLAQRLR